MKTKHLVRVPEHIGVIPDGNRRWAQSRGMNKGEGYAPGVDAGFLMYEMCRDLGVRELTLYGFTRDNTRRPQKQRRQFQRACVDAVLRITAEDADLRVIGDADSPMFPEELRSYTRRQTFGEGGIRVNFLVNYDWAWDLAHLNGNALDGAARNAVPANLASHDVSRIDLIIRWGGRRRLSGFLPVQSVYADVFVHEALWPDFVPEHLMQALQWYQDQDVTLGG